MIGALVQLNCPAVTRNAAPVDRENLDEMRSFWFGFGLYKAGLASRALEFWRLYPATAGVFRSRAEISYQGGSFGAVRRYLDLALEIEPNNFQTHLVRGQLLKRIDPLAAAESLEQAIRIDPQNVQGYLALGELKKEQGDFQTAMRLCSQVIDQAPQNQIAWQCLGEAGFYAQDWAAAERAFQARLSQSPSSAEGLYWLGRTYRYTGQPEKAIPLLIESIEAGGATGPFIPFAWFELGSAYASQGSTGLAIAAFEEVLRIAPDFVYRDELNAQLSDLYSQDRE
jgi:tetratricopeptide (TPR) repeat protein